MIKNNNPVKKLIKVVYSHVIEKKNKGSRNSEGSQEGSLGALSPGVQGLLPSHRTGACLWVQSLSFKVNKLHNHNGKNAIY